MLELSVLNDLRPLARGAHFFVSAFAGLAVYYAISRISSDNRMSRTLPLSLYAAVCAHYFMDLVLRVP